MQRWPTVAIVNTAVIPILNTAVIYHGIISLENVGTAVNCNSIFITLAPVYTADKTILVKSETISNP